MSEVATVTRSWDLVVRYIDGLPPLLIDRLAVPNALVPGGTMLKDGDRCTVVRHDIDNQSWVIKRFNRKHRAHTASHLVLRSRATWCWQNARRLREAGLLTPEPVACVERRLGPLRFESWLVTRYVPGRTLLDYATDPALSPAALEAVADAFGVIWRGLGALRAGHDDMKATNFLVDDDASVWMIDLDGMRLDLPAPLLARERRIDRDRFMRNWGNHPEVAAIFRARIDTA